MTERCAICNGEMDDSDRDGCGQYGNIVSSGCVRQVLSNFRLVEEFGIPAWVGVLVRITDKYSRLVQLTNKTLSGKEAAVKEESIKDTLVDLANYSILAVILFEEWMKPKETKRVTVPTYSQES